MLQPQLILLNLNCRDYVASNGTMVVDYEFEGMWKEAVLVHFKLLPQRLLEGSRNAKDKFNHSSRYPDRDWGTVSAETVELITPSRCKVKCVIKDAVRMKGIRVYGHDILICK